MWELIKKAMVFLGADQLRAWLRMIVETFEEKAKATEPIWDDFVAAVLRACIESENLWEKFVSLLPTLLGLRTDPDVPVTENPEVGAFAEQVAAETGFPVGDVSKVLYGIGK